MPPAYHSCSLFVCFLFFASYFGQIECPWFIVNMKTLPSICITNCCNFKAFVKLTKPRYYFLCKYKSSTGGVVSQISEFQKLIRRYQARTAAAVKTPELQFEGGTVLFIKHRRRCSGIFIGTLPGMSSSGRCPT
ncbi:hypothetical protein RchiOBHm_Chr7g0223771 [Rosa chinensis]|uniref:Secreted protein n=1 Tax=Rosa chinensis TaxID=74649 RepID=A0A2P6PDN2_ROSCH|nr:hypothetical protein RchiOBHm_Chr7g0223771 [Rosa chinensis]